MNLLLAEQVGHGLSVCVAGVVETGQFESTFQRAKQREMVVEDVAPELVEAVVGVDNSHHLVDYWLHRVVVLVPNHDDRVLPSLPDGRSVNGADDFLHGLVAELGSMPG